MEDVTNKGENAKQWNRYEMTTPSRLFLLNTFPPPSPHDISLHYYLLYWIWFFSTGILGPLLSDSLVLRFMAPNITATVAERYSTPYLQNPTKAKASINRFAHIVSWNAGLGT